MASVYFDSSVFLSIFNGEPDARSIRGLLRELKNDKVRIYTSILTIQEVSVMSFRVGKQFDDNHAKVDKLARIYTITREVALTCAKLEAQVIDHTPERDRVENRRRKWDCFHIATALFLGCSELYTNDEGMIARKNQLGIKGMNFSPPLPRKIDLFPEGNPEVRIQ